MALQKIDQRATLFGRAVWKFKTPPALANGVFVAGDPDDDKLAPLGRGRAARKPRFFSSGFSTRKRYTRERQKEELFHRCPHLTPCGPHGQR
jgi:hypothetical protein